jgi:hypothetical protein
MIEPRNKLIIVNILKFPTCFDLLDHLQGYKNTFHCVHRSIVLLHLDISYLFLLLISSF